MDSVLSKPIILRIKDTNGTKTQDIDLSPIISEVMKICARETVKFTIEELKRIGILNVKG